MAADLMTKVSENTKTVKLFTFSSKLPEEESMLLTQTDYVLVAMEPVGDDERTFVTLTETKAYKKKLGFLAYKTLTLDMINNLENADYQSVLKKSRDGGGLETLRSL